MNRGGYRPQDAIAEPVAVLQAAIQQLAQRQDQQLQKQLQQQQQHHQHQHAEHGEARRQREVPPFLPAERFQGARQGYFFGTGDDGTGYYRDEQQELEPEGTAVRQQQDPAELLRQAEEAAEAAEVQLLDEKSLRKMLNALEKKAKENLELRMKHADEPMKFLDNEVDLMSIIRGLAQVGADANTLYPLFLDGPAPATLAGLLAHDNTDIALEVLDLLQELTDADEVEDTDGVCGRLVDAFGAANGLELLVQLLGRLNEGVDEEAAGVNNALAVMEHALELRPSLAEPLLSRTKLLKWLLARIKVKGCDSNKQYASEVLSILMQGHEANQAALGKASGVDTLLVCLAGFKSREPADALEAEFVENVFDTLCSCLLLPANRAAFVECEGVELMHLLLKGKKSSRYGAIKTIDFATTRSPAACDRLVEAGALAQLFALFMGRSKIRNSKGEAGDADVLREVEQRCVSIIANLFQGVTKNSRKERLAAKFVEAEFEKVDRLMEIVFRYEAAVSAVEARLAQEAQELGEEEVDPEELAMERLDAGLFTLQCGAVVVGALWGVGEAGLRRRLLACLHQRGQTLEMIRNLLREFYFSLGDDGAPDERTRQLQRLAQLLEGLGVDIGAEAAQQGLQQQQQQQQQQQEGDEAAAEEQQQQQQAGADGQADGDGEAGPELEDDGEQPPLPPDEEPAAAAEQAHQQQQHGNGISQQQEQQQQQQGLSPPPDRQAERRVAAQQQPDSRERDGGQAAGRQEGQQGDGVDRDLGRHRERERDRDRDDRRRRRSSRSGSPRDREHGERDKDRERDRHRSSRRRSHSRSRSPRDRREDRKSGSSSKHKRRRHSRSASPR